MRAGERATAPAHLLSLLLSLALLPAPLPASPAPAGDPDWHIPLASPDAGPQEAADAVRLQAALAHYEQLAAAGGWPALPPGTLPAPGERDPRVVELRARLRLGGDFEGLPGTADAWFFDAGLQRAIGRFQARHGLPATGELDARTRAALDVPVESRVQQLRATLTRWNWLPRDLGARYLWVNAAGGNLELIDHGAPLIAMRIIAGHPSRPTPSFSDSIRQIVVNPAWSVPRTIAVEDLLPWQQEDPGFLARLRIRVIADDGREVDAARVRWRALDASHFPYRLRQDPGPRNALGRLKFVTHNPWDIFLHDTPSRRLFDLNSRTLSSGCLRLEEPEALAAMLVNDPAALTSALSGTATRTLELAEPVPLYVVYLTSWVTPEGVVNFRPDVYGRDARLR